MNNDSSAPQPGERATGEHVCPECGEPFSDGTDYEDGDSCMPCCEQWFETWFNENRAEIKQAVAILKQRGQWQ